MRKIAQRFAAAVATVLLVALLTGFAAPQALASSAFAPDCQTNQMTGQIDCGGTRDVLVGLIVFVILVIIAAAINSMRK